MKNLILAFLAFSILNAADLPDIEPAKVAVPPVPQTIVYKDIKSLSVEAVRALEAFNKEEEKLRVEYEKKVKVERGKLLKGLELAKVNATKSGKLEEALACKTVTELINPDIQARIAKNKVNRVVGEWRLNNSMNMNFTEDGISIRSNGDRGKWEITENKFIVSWKSGYKDTYTIGENSSDTIDGINNDGVRLILIRIKH